MQKSSQIPVWIHVESQYPSGPNAHGNCCNDKFPCIYLRYIAKIFSQALKLPTIYINEAHIYQENGLEGSAI